MSQYVLACDEGTSSARAVAFDREARAAATTQSPVASTFPQSGWVEQDAEQIWQTQLVVARDAALQCGGWQAIAAIGITNQRENHDRLGPRHRNARRTCRRLAVQANGRDVRQVGRLR